MTRVSTAIWCLSLCALKLGTTAQPPHILHILTDDLGWAEVGWHTDDAQTNGEVRTPNMDALVAEGIELDRLYNHKICSPSRCAIQTGRAPIHVNVQNVEPEVVNPQDPVSGYQGIPVNMSTVAHKLKEGGYATHFVGKWDIGMATPMHAPQARGYDTWLGYWHHANDYYTQAIKSSGCGATDLWRVNATVNAPATELANGPSCSFRSQTPAEGERCVYEEELFADEVVQIMTDHVAASSADGTEEEKPLFLFYSMHLAHFPLQAPQEYLDEFKFVDDLERRAMRAMVHYLDNAVGRVVNASKELGLWENMVVVLHSDNGGEIIFEGTCGGNNWPLRGGKFSNWEGGIRTVGLVAGGYVPEAVRGTKSTQLVAGWDWFATYAAFAGVDASDPEAEKAGLPPPDSIDVWPSLTTNVTGRTSLVIGDTSALRYNGDGDTLVGGLLYVDPSNGHLIKLLVGAKSKADLILQDVTTSPLFPNRSFASALLAPQLHGRVCGRSWFDGCLFDLTEDPIETRTISRERSNRALFKTMLGMVQDAEGTVFSPDRGSADDGAACAATANHDGYWGPWL